MSLNATGRPRSGVDGRRGCFGGAARSVEIEADEGADRRLARGDRLGAQFDDGARREFAGFDTAGKIERGQHHDRPRIFFALTSMRYPSRASDVARKARPDQGAAIMVNASLTVRAPASLNSL